MFKNKLALLFLNIAFNLLPNGYTVKMWKWNTGHGNYQVFSCPNDGKYSNSDVLHSHN
jgi:hypothetical protein